MEKALECKLHQHLKVHLWRILVGALPTREVLGQRLQIVEHYYVLCIAETDSSLHIFKECPVVRALAFASKWGYRIDF